VQTQIGRIRLGRNERLSLVANPSLDPGDADIKSGDPAITNNTFPADRWTYWTPRGMPARCPRDLPDGGGSRTFQLGTGSKAVYDALRENIPFKHEDAYMPNQTGPALEMVRSGAILDVVEKRIAR
jgi:hypothetical protein